MRLPTLLLAATAAAALPVLAQPSAPAGRGALLYDTHCVECHTSQVHWRARRLARDWGSLREEVLRWQATARLDWSPADVDEVTRYLNDTVYRFEPPARVSGR